MIYSVEVTNHLGESLMLELADPWQCGLAIQEIKGLGPGKANINVTDISTSDGALFNSSRRDKRNIVFKIKMLPAPTIEDSRQRMYKYFPLKKKVTLHFITDNRDVKIDGYVENNDPVIFNKSVTSQISIICPDPYFYSIDTNHTMFHGEEPLFEFPFENEDLIQPTIEIGEIKFRAYRNIFYDGDEEIGITLSINANGTVKDINIFNIDTGERLRIDDAKLEALTGSGLVKGDKIIINTMNNRKGIKLIRDGITINILNALDRDSAWFKLHKGNNVFAYTVSEGNNFLHFSIDNDIIYEGI